MAKNKVIAGDYKGRPVGGTSSSASILVGMFKPLFLNKDNVAEYEVLEEQSRKSATSAVGRAFVGGMILGPVGWLAGLSAKNKGTHTIAISFKDGKKSLIEVDSTLHKAIITQMF